MGAHVTSPQVAGLAGSLELVCEDVWLAVFSVRSPSFVGYFPSTYYYTTTTNCRSLT